MFSELIAGGTCVGDLSDLQQLGAVFVRTLLGIEGAQAGPALAVLTPTSLAVGLARLLFRDRQALPMSALLRMVQGYDDIRLLFFQASPAGMLRQSVLAAVRLDSEWLVAFWLQACAMARSIPTAPAEEADRLVQDSTACFFRVATVFENAQTAQEQVEMIRECVREMQHDLSQSSRNEGLQAAELQYYETLMLLYERLGCHAAASRLALAAAEQVRATETALGSCCIHSFASTHSFPLLLGTGCHVAPGI